MSSSVDSKNDQMVLFHFVNPHSRSVYIWDCLSQSSCILMFSRGCARGMTTLFCFSMLLWCLFCSNRQINSDPVPAPINGFDI
ncbi:hypothetical protein MTR_4g014470 [Medicago truncatula]|uniref:Uncharacterized protein n=1 Tax=Medicago truncatula TaxID=3880 RepID=G7JKP7_MEDTR|nr:hypothetical protein MTR_4g014470 [Medicago truncatula]